MILTGIEKLRKDPKEAIIRYLENPLDTTVFILTHDDSKKFKTEKTLSATAAEHGEDAALAAELLHGAAYGFRGKPRQDAEVSS